jgi:hypothetical protein
MHVVRDMGKADDEQLAAIRESATRLLDESEQFMGGDLVEALCLWREAAERQQKHRAQHGASGDAQVKQLRVQQAS